MERRLNGQPTYRHECYERHHRNSQFCHRYVQPDLQCRGQRLAGGLDFADR